MESRATGFNPQSYPDVPLYNIQAVAAATGVPSITLRSWERRYGIPRPKRDPKGYRLYSERDVAVTRWLKERVQQGVGISRAVNMLRVLERGDLGPEPHGTFNFDELRTRLLDAVMRLDESTAGRVIAEGLMVASVEDVVLNLLQLTLYEIGELWARGQISVTTEHVTSGIIRGHIAQLVRISPAPLRDEQILVGCAPGEQHDIGALTLALFLRRRGFDVIFAGANLEAESLKADVLRLAPTAVCLSAARPPAAIALAALYRALESEYHGLLIFGGQAYNNDPELIESTPGHFLGADAAEGVDQLIPALAALRQG